MPAVSVILPTYNRAHCLERAVRSVALQSFEDWELIIIDDGSTDNTADLCRSFADQLGSKMRYFRRENQGVSSARNFGIEQASADLIAFQDSDDFWYRDKLGVQVSALKEAQGESFCFTGFSTFGDDGRFRAERCRIPPELLERIYPGLYRIKYNVIVAPSVVCSRDLLREVGGFDTRMSMCEDIDLWGRITTVTRSVVVDLPLVGVHVRWDEEYPYLRALEGRATLYWNLLERDTTLDAGVKYELFNELFSVFRLVAERSHMSDVSRLAESALRLVEEAQQLARVDLLHEAVTLMRTGLIQSGTQEGR